MGPLPGVCSAVGVRSGSGAACSWTSTACVGLLVFALHRAPRVLCIAKTWGLSVLLGSCKM